MWYPTEAQRAYIYNILIALSPLLVSYGLVSETDLVAWVGLLSAVLGLGLARANTTTKPPVE